MRSHVEAHVAQWRDAAVEAGLDGSAELWGEMAIALSDSPSHILALASALLPSSPARALAQLTSTPSLSLLPHAALLAARCHLALNAPQAAASALAAIPPTPQLPLDAMASPLPLAAPGAVGIPAPRAHSLPSLLMSAPVAVWASSDAVGAGWWWDVPQTQTQPSSRQTSATATATPAALPTRPSASASASASATHHHPDTTPHNPHPPPRTRAKPTALSPASASVNAIAIDALPPPAAPTSGRAKGKAVVAQQPPNPNPPAPLATPLPPSLPPAILASIPSPTPAQIAQSALGGGGGGAGSMPRDEDGLAPGEEQDVLVVAGTRPVSDEEWDALPAPPPTPLPFPPYVIRAALMAQTFLRQGADDAANKQWMQAGGKDVRCWENVGGGWAGPALETFLSLPTTPALPPPLLRLVCLVYLVLSASGGGAGSPSASRVRRALAALETEFGLRRGKARGLELAWARRLGEEGRWGEAVGVTGGLLSTDPHHPPTLLLHATLLAHLRLPTPLFRLAHLLHASLPDTAPALYAAGCYYLVADRMDEARKWFLRCAQADPRCAVAWVGFGHAWAAEGEGDSAVAAYAEAGKVDRGSHVPDLYMGVEHLRQGNAMVARGYFERARDKCPGDPAVHNETGVMWYGAGSYDKAVECFREALRCAGEREDRRPVGWKETWCNLGNALVKLRRYDEASATFRHVLSAFPRHQPAHLGLGFSEHLAWRIEAAIAAYHAALALGGSDFAQDMLERAVREGRGRGEWLVAGGGCIADGG
ncbi:TPR-like protein [Gonapodya prolifera JEL478]|uniref:TPR-like protein n=1 Tax=Gonapodya prolifera (strain JEL478) TaxID=1344416 RepID=A0A139AMH4_GONPJ|nr:TPR-like protein [Gonapodya prolifera JEL478]|eukprot:KXS17971.1 TPR-like protein [Gonapodya prolifera JEL478]